jgi:4-hydroxy-tetrahydrodipicolinate synthase
VVVAQEKQISGSMTALVTPFKPGGVDFDAFEKFVDWQIEEGINGLVPCGTTGETSTLGTTEHIEVMKTCVDVAAGRVPIIAGIGSNNTVSAVYMAKEAQRIGADAVLAVAPYYNKPNQEGMLHHFKIIAESIDIGVIIYNVPSRSVVDIELDTMSRLAEIPNIIGIKDATSDLTRVTEYKKRCGEGFIQLSGDDPTALAHWAHGGSGCISVASNVAPAACARFHAACAQKDFDGALMQHEKLDRLFKDLFLCPSPAPAKYALSLMGMMSEDVRLPLVNCSEATKTTVRAAMKQAGIEV